MFVISNSLLDIKYCEDIFGENFNKLSVVPVVAENHHLQQNIFLYKKWFYLYTLYSSILIEHEKLLVGKRQNTFFTGTVIMQHRPHLNL